MRNVKVRGLQHVSSPIPEGGQGEARRFYGELLGLQEKPVPATLDGSKLVWFAAGASLELHFFPGEQAPRSERHFCLDVDNLQAVRKALEDAGLEPYDTTPIPGRPRFFCRDPFQNLVEITSIEQAP
jgi:catechol 2,3-dioxygenase-like lactoylglutathione lyase family enzyme